VGPCTRGLRGLCPSCPPYRCATDDRICVCGCVNYTAVPWEPASTATRDAAPARLGAAPGESVRFYGNEGRRPGPARCCPWRVSLLLRQRGGEQGTAALHRRRRGRARDHHADSVTGQNRAVVDARLRPPRPGTRQDRTMSVDGLG